VNSPEAEVWTQLAPLLDEALNELGETDRAALVLRYFENQSAREVAAALRMQEAAVQKRVTRALEKLRTRLVKRGVTLTTTALAGAVAANAVQAAPLGLANTISVVAVAKGAAAGVSTLAIVKGALKLMKWAKLKVTAALGGLLLGTSITVVAIDTYISDKDLTDFTKAPPSLVIQPTHFQNYEGILARSDSLDGILVGRNRSLKDMIAEAYRFHTSRIIFPEQMPTNRYDYLVSVAGKRHEKFQSEIAKFLGYTARIETRVVEAQILKLADSGREKMKPGRKLESPASQGFYFPNHPVSVLAEALEYRFRMPVVDQTGLVGNFYMVVNWHWQGYWNGRDRVANLNSLKHTLLDQLGLELVTTNMPVEMLVIEKLK